jgi:hypothetical protein
MSLLDLLNNQPKFSSTTSTDIAAADDDVLDFYSIASSSLAVISGAIVFGDFDRRSLIGLAWPIAAHPTEFRQILSILLWCAENTPFVALRARADVL